ncbi:YheC/YheD family protein [Metasolibacillus fluoroglycofenilyticus]|uniref:YheC/YheD family protein n=1 Tax=Metasolibacillus fluoroglycofenilyticus TaxID=1239396 RepID=UPI000D349F48|nr:YheC/YheD family protein [Metasolibacillus fluoroglycofenilyticus]
MTTIGMLHHRKDPTTVLKSYAFAAVAKVEGVDFFYFTPKSVNFTRKTILAQVYENGAWYEKECPFPDVIYNAGSPEKLAVSKDIIGKLRKEIPFTTNSIGNKWNVAKRLLAYKDFAKYIIPTEIIQKTETVHQHLAKYPTIAFKPIDGRKGKGIYFISKEGTSYTVKHNSTVTKYTKTQLDALLAQQLATGTFIVQPYIRSVTKSGLVFDFRLHVQKNGDGNWVVTTVYPRVAPAGSLIPNINNGGYTNYLEPFLQQEFAEQAYDLKRTLEHFSLSLARHLEHIQIQEFGELIDEIGVDVGLDQNMRLWIYEVNWRPGCPPTFYLELDVVKNTIRYAKYLADNKQVLAKARQAKRVHKAQQQEQLVTKPIAKSQVRPSDMPIIAITGSAGKTTTKAFLSSILRTKWSTFESKDYWNTTEHTKKHAMELANGYEAAVLEYGMAYKGVITEHCRILKPTMSIVTNVGLAHVGNFDGDVKQVALAKSELIQGMDQHGVLVINKDDFNSNYLTLKQFKGKIITVGIHSDADYRAYNVRYKEDGMTFKIKLRGKEISLFIPILGEHHVYNALNAIALADYLQFSPQEIKQGLVFKKPPRRLTLYHCKRAITLIDDTVHSHPQGVKAAIDVLSSIAKRRKVAIIGQMRELGDLREAEYKKVGEYITEQGIDIFITYGFRTEEMNAAAKAKGFNPKNMYHFTNKEQLHDLLEKIIKQGDTILIKGASKTNMFETVKFLADLYEGK